MSEAAAKSCKVSVKAWLCAARLPVYRLSWRAKQEKLGARLLLAEPDASRVDAWSQRWQAAGRGSCGARMIWPATPAIICELAVCCVRALDVAVALWADG